MKDLIPNYRKPPWNSQLCQFPVKKILILLFLFVCLKILALVFLPVLNNFFYFLLFQLYEATQEHREQVITLQEKLEILER